MPGQDQKHGQQGQSSGSEQPWVKHSKFAEIHRIYFEPNSSVLSDDDLNVLKIKLENLKGKIVRFEITGFADKSGSKKINEQLSLKRALAVKEWITDNLEIPSAYISVSGRMDGTNIYSPRSKNRVVVIKATDPW